MRIAILHYHLRPGGVTRVIEMAVEALKGQGLEPLVISGESPPEGCRVRAVEVVEDLAYGATSADGLMTGVDQACRRHWGAGADLLHTHNHSLGKNLALPLAVRTWAREGRSLLLQMHDFAENGRPANYQFLRDGLGGEQGLSQCLYPCGTRVAHGVLNSEAAAVLRKAGGHAAFLPNPVCLPEGIRPALASEFGADSLVVVPTRGIRRKNLGEVLLHAAAAEEGRLFLVTSSPAPGPERPAYDRWQAFARGLALPVLFDVAGQTGRSVYDFLAGGDLCLTTSIEEGFGMAFLEPWAAGKNLVGRDIPAITQDFKASGLCLDHLYASLDIELSKPEAQILRDHLGLEAKSASAAFGIDLPKSTDEMPWGTKIDFARLPPVMQCRQIERAAAGKLKVPKLVRCSPTVAKENARIVQTCYAPETYAHTLRALYQQLCEAKTQPVHFLDTHKVLLGFLQR